MKSELVLGTKNLSSFIKEGILDFKKFIKKNKIKYLEVSIDYDNDITLKNILGNYISELKIISRINVIDKIEETLEFHRYFLGKFPDIILVPSQQSYEGIDYLEDYGLYDVRDIEDLKRFEKAYGHYPNIISLKSCPYNFNYDLVEFCRDNDIKTIAYEIYGGRYSGNYIVDAFSQNYLTNFALFNHDFACISCESLDDLYSAINTWNNYDFNKLETAILNIKCNKDLLPLKKTPNKLIRNYNDIDLGTFKVNNLENPNNVISYDNFSIKEKPVSVLINNSEIGEKIQEEINSWSFPIDLDESNLKLKSAYLRYVTNLVLDEFFNTKYWKKVFSIQDNVTLIKIIPKPFWGFWMKEHVFILIPKLNRVVKLTLKEYKKLKNSLENL